MLWNDNVIISEDSRIVARAAEWYPQGKVCAADRYTLGGVVGLGTSCKAETARMFGCLDAEL
jgi:hypothetical protein